MEEAASSKKNYSDDDINSQCSEEAAPDETMQGVRRMDAVNAVLSEHRSFTVFGARLEPLKIALLVALFLQGYCTGLGGQISQSIQTYAANSFAMQPQLGSISTVKSIIAAAVVIPYARLSDRFGRIECWILALVFYTVGDIISAATPTFGGLFAGVVIQQFGYSGFRFLASAMTADLSGLRDRTFAMNIFLIPVIINTWVSGDIVDALAGNSTPYKWRWGYGIFCIIVPFSTFILVIPYAYARHLSLKKKRVPSIKTCGKRSKMA